MHFDYFSGRPLLMTLMYNGIFPIAMEQYGHLQEVDHITLTINTASVQSYWQLWKLTINSYMLTEGSQRNCNLFTAMENNTRNIPNPEPLMGDRSFPLPYMFVSDDAFPFQLWMQNILLSIHVHLLRSVDFCCFLHIQWVSGLQVVVPSSILQV